MQNQIIAIMKRFITFLTLLLLGFFAFSQNTSPLVVKDFAMTNEVLDLEQIPKDARTDWDGNPVCQLVIAADGFDESLMQKFVVVPNGLDIMSKTIKNGQMVLLISSNKKGEINVKYMGDCIFALPNKLEAANCYKLLLGMATAPLVIDASPAEAEVFIDDELVGKGRVTMNVTIGMGHRYRVACEDYFPEDGVVELSVKETKEIKVALEPSFGWITVTSQPSAADVFVDGRNFGKTPLSKAKIKRGPHRVEVKKTGYSSVVKLVKISAGVTNTELDSIMLEAKEVKFGGLTIMSKPEGADVTIDGEKMGQTPMTIDDIIIGNHDVELNYKGYFPITQSIVVIENDTTVVNLELIKGQDVMIITDKKRDKIFIDGKLFGFSPLKTILTVGSHDLVVVRGGNGENLTELMNGNNTAFCKKTLTVNKSESMITEEIKIPVYSQTITVEGVSFDMIAVEGGTFMMGVDKQNQMTVADFSIGKYEVTEALWNAVMKDVDEKTITGENMPVAYVNWYDAIEFCNRLSEKCELKPYYIIEKNGDNISVICDAKSDGFRLPTEAEWEYAARGGNKSKNYLYSGAHNIYNVAWFSLNSGDKELLQSEVEIYDDKDSYNQRIRKSEKIYKIMTKNNNRAHSVGLKSPNELGIYDMSGNLAEWCYENVGGAGAFGYDRIMRGGDFYELRDYCKPERKRFYDPDRRADFMGFRLVLNY